MSSNPKATRIASSYTAGSPLDQIVNGSSPSMSSRRNLLDRAVTLTRKPTNQSQSQWSDSPVDSSSSQRMQYNDNAAVRDSYGYAMSGPEDSSHMQQAVSPSSTSSSSRQRILDLRVGRLHQQQLAQSPPLPISSSSPLQDSSDSRFQQSPSLLGNAFRDSTASDRSFNSISGLEERYSMLGSPSHQRGELQQDSDRIAIAVQGLALRRRQSIDTVRSSEFGDGGKWDRAWGGSDEEDDDDMEEYGVSLDDVDIDGKTRNQWDVNESRDRQWQSEKESKRATLTPGCGIVESEALPALHNSPGIEHVVSLTPSMTRTRQRLDPTHKQDDRLQRRDTILSIAGDIGWEDLTSTSTAHVDSRDSIQSQEKSPSHASLASQSNAHVYVWPPTPAASEHGGSSEGNHVPDLKKDTLQAYSPGMGVGQRATVETMQVEPQTQQTPPSAPVSTASTTPRKPWSPSTALAHATRAPSTPDKFNNQSSGMNITPKSGARHPTGRIPPQPPLQSPQEDRYADPNLPISSNSAFAELGEARRQAIADRDGRESLVSDLDVETLRLDGSNDGDSRRGSITSIGSFSSEKIREQRQRQSQASVYSSYSQASNEHAYTDKRSSNGTIRDTSTMNGGVDVQHRSWNGGNMRYAGLSDLSPEQADQRRRGPPKRSNTGPDSYQQDERVQHSKSRLSTGPRIEQQQRSVSNPQTQTSSLTFSTPIQSDRLGKKPSIAVKGAMNDTQAEKFLSLAITHHESGDLSRSAYYFERSAKVDGGCTVGMCMWGMALREGWGVRKDQVKGFDWISRAAARAGELMAGTQSSLKSETELKAIRSEMKLSVYELGKCFCYGWGVKMDKLMALEYFELAAKLGDADAQAEAGALLAAGKGCKKDLKKAATYYRMAEAQGYDTVGLSWIHKDKYDP